MDVVKIKNENGRKKKSDKAKETYDKYGKNTTRGVRIKTEKQDDNNTQIKSKNNPKK
ncbi:MAG: hypothetical protein Terrestrivirus9_43 [Terrestrivirus sp.]|uniref:Uncharacterized protein n=1 Tax=Terrestrivirus sp. TaxID=2487775 RepID=A0A3G4ZP09_9VIRU|nr:MAG: hypothetical protein Terrestrivirus9_43 [Terrestrivirus sp.]